jgi:hypothetical protein
LACRDNKNKDKQAGQEGGPYLIKDVFIKGKFQLKPLKENTHILLILTEFCFSASQRKAK